MNRGDGGVNGVVPTIWHTGTWFLVHVLKVLRQGSVLPWAHSFEVGGGLPINWMQIHVPDLTDEEKSNRRYLNAALIDAFVESGRYPIVVPVRDPVRSLITLANRRDQDGCPPSGPLVAHARKFETVARWFEDHPNAFFFPVDLYESVRDRRTILNQLASFVGVVPDQETAALAREWPRHNPTTDDPTGLRDAYERGDLDAIESAFPDELGVLRESREVLGMYEHLGYFLPWAEAHRVAM